MLLYAIMVAHAPIAIIAPKAINAPMTANVPREVLHTIYIYIYNDYLLFSSFHAIICNR